MYRVRSKAHQEARRGDGGGIWNPFGKPYWVRKKELEEEFGGIPENYNIPQPHPRTHSEPLPRVSEEDPRHGDVDKDIAPPSQKPKHADTAPASSMYSDEAPSPTTKDLAHASVESQSALPLKVDTFSDDSSGPRQRKITSWSHDSQKKLTDYMQGAFRKDSDDSEKPKKIRRKFGFWPQMKAIFGSWINLLLVLGPIGIGLGAANANGYAVFIVNFVAIIPLAGLLSYATEEISLRTGETLGGLLNASFGNATELIVSIIALAQNQIIIVQTSLIGSMLSNLLLVLGMCFFLGGINRPKQNFNVQVAQTSASLLSIAVASLIIPTTFHRWGLPATEEVEQGITLGPDQREAKVPELSRGIAVMLLVVYGCYLFFQLKTHRELFKETGEKQPKRKSSKTAQQGAKKSIVAVAGPAAGGILPLHPDHYKNVLDREAERVVEEDEEEQPRISAMSAIATLIIATGLIGACSEYMVDGIAYVVRKGHISPEFIGLILIPIVGNAAEHATAVTVAIKDKMDLAIGVAVGSSLQISLFVLPVAVIVGWGLDNPRMTLEFDGFLIALLFVAVLLTNYLIQDGSSHWLEGVQLMSLYVMIAVAAWFYPTTEDVVG